jgi:hypothetical protein
MIGDRVSDFIKEEHGCKNNGNRLTMNWKMYLSLIIIAAMQLI